MKNVDRVMDRRRFMAMAAGALAGAAGGCNLDKDEKAGADVDQESVPFGV